MSNIVFTDEDALHKFWEEGFSFTKEEYIALNEFWEKDPETNDETAQEMIARALFDSVASDVFTASNGIVVTVKYHENKDFFSVTIKEKGLPLRKFRLDENNPEEVVEYNRL